MSPSPARPRFALRLTLCSALLGLCLGLNAPARAGSDEQFVAARDAFRAGDRNKLERAAGLALSPEHSRVMLCGNPQMIEDTRAVLKARNLNLALTRRPGQVAVENYW